MTIKINERKYANTSEIISFRLRDMIRQSELSSGDKLPPERDLAKKMGVSRPTLRAGIRSLTAVGFLVSRQGAGNFVAEPNESPMLDSAPLKMLAAIHRFSDEEMFETRIVLEMHIAELAAVRATSEHIAKLAEEIAEMFASLDEPERFLIHDMRFHQAIAEASGNRILTVLINLITQILFEMRSKTVYRAKDLKEAAEIHRKIYRAIRERKPKEAGKTMREHLVATQKARLLENQSDTTS